MQVKSKSVLTEFYSGSMTRVIFSLGLGLTISFLILYGIIKAQHLNISKEEPLFEELHAVVIPPPPPPPPRYESQTPPPPLPNLPQFDTAPDKKPIQIAYSAQPVINQARPTVKPFIEFRLGEFKPNVEPPDSKRVVYKKSEVDRPPILIFRKIPDISTKLFSSVQLPRVSLLYIVNTKGRVESVNLFGSASPEFDSRVIEAVKKCRFKPALKDGKVVNCWIKQRITVKSRGHNAFSAR